VLVCLVVPLAGTDAADAVARAVRQHHRDAELAAVWAGDPQLRPRAAPEGAAWVDIALHEPSGVGWNRLYVALPPPGYGWARAARATEQLLAAGDGVVVLHVGTIAVAGRFDDALPASGVAAIERVSGLPPADGQAPGVHDLAACGRYATGALGFAAGTHDVARAIADAFVASDASAGVGRLLEIAIAVTGRDVHPIAGGHSLGWRELPAPARPSLLDVEQLDRDEPWRVDFGTTAPRARLSDDPELASLVAELRPQWDAGHAVARLPGGMEVDDVVRTLTADALAAWRRGDGELPPEPYGPGGSAFVEWLETPWPPWGPDVGRYWSEVRRRRPDLITAFPHPEGADHDGFVAWIRSSWAHDGRWPLLRTGSRGMRPPWHDGDRRPGGVNLVGYLGFDKSLGDVARRIHRCLTDAGVPVAALHYHRSGSPSSADTPELTDALVYDTNIVVVNADQTPLLAADYGDVLFPGRHTISYWFWELAHIPPYMVEAAELVDEIWVATDFTTDALRAATTTPVRTVPIPVPEPVPSAATRAELDVPEGRFVFLVTLDHLSVTERKNPVAAVEAFRRAFPEPSDTGPVLYVKTLNRSHRWAEHERIKVAAGGRPDVVVVDRHLSRPDQMALTATADCMVSLHRAEGLGLHLMEAMWLGTPTIATRYSGNLAFMDDTNSALVDATLVDVVHGERYFPAEAQWAEPDLDQAATWMRRMVDEPDLRRRLAAAGRAAMERQASTADVGREIARLTGMARSEAAEMSGSGG